MTPEAKAREIALRLVGNPYGIDESDLEFIAQALRDVERETLERAAKIAESFHDDDDRVDRQVKRQVAQSIRSLLQKEGG